MSRLEKLLRPRSVAVIGGRVAVRAVRQLEARGFEGEIWPVNSGRHEIQGRRCHPSLAELPAAPDAAYVAVNRDATIEVVRELAAMGCGAAVCHASGFAEMGAEGAALQAALVEAAGAMPFLGPNCYGVINYLDGSALWPDQQGGVALDRGVAILSQSGNIGLNLTMSRRALPIALVMTLGNQARIGLGEALEAVLDDARISAVGLHIEGLTQVAALERAANRARDQKVPLLALKTGRSSAGADAARTHTAALATDDRVTDAFLERVGIGRAGSLTGFLEALKLLHIAGPLAGTSIGAICSSGGEAALLADAAATMALDLRALTQAEQAALGAVVDPLVRVSNPLDYHTFSWGDGAALERLFTAFAALGFDLTALVQDWPHPGRCDDAAWQIALEAYAAASRATGAKTAIVATLPECMPEPVAERIARSGIVPLLGIEDALEAAALAAAVGRSFGRPAPPPLHAPSGERSDALVFDEWKSKGLLAREGVPVPQGRLVVSPAEAAAAAEELGWPVVVKAVASGLAHKSEAGAVRLHLGHGQAVMDAADALMALGERLLVERHVDDAVAELIVGIERDPSFGLMLLVGSGGTLVELAADSAIRLLPASADDIRSALRSIKAAALIDGYRGASPGDWDATVEAITAIVRFAERHADELVSLDVNPLIVRPKGRGAVAADALLVAGPGILRAP